MKTFKRPMFRKGGNVGTGIMTGITDRVQAQDGFTGEEFQTPSYSRQLTELQANTPIDTSVRAFKPMEYENINIDELVGPTKSTADYIAELRAGAGEYGGMDPLTSFLLTAGPSVASATSFADAISKLNPATQQLIKQADAKAKYERDLRLAGTKLGLAAKEKADDQRFSLKLKDLDAENQVNFLNDARAYEQLKEEDKRAYDEQIRKQSIAIAKLNEEDRKKYEERLLAEGRAFELDKLKKEQDFQEKIINKQLEAENQYKEKDFMETYENNSLQARNRANYENDKVQSKMDEKFGSQNGGLAGGIHGDLEKKKKNKNVGKVYYDVNDGKIKRLRKKADGQFEYEVINIDTFTEEKLPDPSIAEKKKKKEIDERFEYLSDSQREFLESLKGPSSLDEGTYDILE
tara:strand:- start:140 stop:1354 length:1215 start_codon:yes stop_codon:yes gene_type:complete